MKKQFETEFVLINDILILTIEGQILEESKIDKLLSQVEEKMKKSKGKIALDLNKLKHINSSGLNFFIKIHKLALTYNKKLIIARPSSSVKNVITIAKMDEVFIMARDLNDAFFYMI